MFMIIGNIGKEMYVFFTAKFILKLKVCKCSKYNKLLIYMSLLNQCSVSESEKLIFPLLIRTLTGVFVQETDSIGNAFFWSMNYSRPAWLSCEMDNYYETGSRSIKCLESGTGCYWLELMTTYEFLSDSSIIY